MVLSSASIHSIDSYQSCAPQAPLAISAICVDLMVQNTMSSNSQTALITTSSTSVRALLTCRIVTDFSDLQQIRAEWCRLWKLSPRPYVFQSFEWARAWWTAFGSECRLFAPVVYSGDQVAGILPLVLRGRVIHFLGPPQSDYNDIICDPRHAAAVLRTALESLFALRTQWDECHLSGARTDSLIVSAVEALPQCLRRYLSVDPHSECPAIVASSGEGDYLALAKKQSIRRHRKKLERTGTVRFRQLEDPSEMRSHLPSLFKQHMERRQGASEFLLPSVRLFFHSLIDELASTGYLRFAVLELDSRPVAYHFGFECDRRFIWYKPSFDQRFAQYGPGEVLLGQLFEYCSAHDIEEFDFTVGREQFKYRFANSVPNTVTLLLQPHLLDRVVHRGVQFGKQCLLPHPKLARMVRRIVRGGL